ncbi:MAG: GNAT family N-acetyltransferase [bacterium]|nr:GNAT family N-acetyltransferase [bacterium]
MRFARTRGDLEDACRLRFAVFNLELSEGLDESYATGLDVDEFDEQCQHLVVEDTKTGEVVGTYRLQVYESARSSAGLYSAGEFDFSTVEPCVLEASIELGRACVARGHRSRGVLFLLWRGLCEYLLFNGKRGFFGCSSLTSQDENEGVRFYRQLARAGHVHPGLRVAPRADFVCVEDLARQTGARVKPPMLFDIYLKYGAQVLGPPAIDRRFGTIDFLTYHAPTPKQLKTFAGRSE